MSAREVGKDLFLSLPQFDGFPYLVTRVAGAMHHLIVLPRDLSVAQLEQLARRQHAANRLRTCLVLAADSALYISDEGDARSDTPPRSGIPVSGHLLPPEAFRFSLDLLVREQRLLRFVEAHQPTGYLIDKPAGRAPTLEERVRLIGADAMRIPNGLFHCRWCEGWRGETVVDLGPSARGLVEHRDLLVRVFCACENHNRCARCLRPLYEQRLDAWSYFGDERKVLFVPGFCGLSHACTGDRP